MKTAIILAAVLTTSGAAAQSEREISELFIGHCIHALPDHERIKASARVLSWQPLSADMARMFAPADPQAIFQGWIVQMPGGRKHMIGISSGNIDGTRAAACAVASLDFSQDALIKELSALSLELTPLSDEKQPGQRMRMWNTNVGQHKMIIALLSSLDAKEPGGRLSATLFLP